MKVKIALIFVFLFSILLITPTVISLIDNTQDIALFIDVNEEEENLSTKIFKEVKISTNLDSVIPFISILKKINVSFTSKEYTSLFQKITTPPPKFAL